MENSYYLNLFGRDFVKDRERKAAYYSTSECLVNNRIRERIIDDAYKRLVDPAHEIEIKIFLLVGVPLASFGKFTFGVGSKPNDHR